MKNLKLEKMESYWIIRLNRPDIFNALNEELILEIKDLFEQAAKEKDLRLVVLTGEGKAFCSGADLKSGISEPNLGNILRRTYNPMIKAIRNLPIPVLAYVNGPAAGAGCSLALACDYIIADENAYFAELFALIGLAVDAGSTAFLMQTMGYQKAFEIVSSARKIPASEAMQIGWVSKIVNSDNSEEILQNEIDRFIQMPTKAIGLMKLALQKAHNSSLDEILELEADNQTIAGQSHDFAEGVMAFLQKRPAKFMGK